MVDWRVDARKILFSHYQQECEVVRTGVLHNAPSFIHGGRSRAELVVKIMSELDLVSEKEAEQCRHHLQEIEKGD